MKTKKSLYLVTGAVILVAVLSILAIFWPAPASSETIQAAEKIIITDALGREVALDEPAQTIACTHYSVAEAMQLAGAWDKAVTRGEYLTDEDFYPGVNNLPAVCPQRNPLDLNYEKIIEIHPDLVILPNFGWLGDSEEIINTLEPDVPVIFVDTLNPDKFCETIDIIGRVAGTEEQAGEYIEFFRSVYDPVVAVTANIPEEERPNIFFKAFSDEIEDIKTYGSEFPGGNELFNAAGARNIAEDLPINCADVDKEWLLEQDIDAIAAICWDKKYPDAFGYDAPDPSVAREIAEGIRTEISELDVLSNSNAVKNNEIYLLGNEMTSTPRYIITIAYMAKWFHPELFEDLDPQGIHQEYLDRFIPGDIDLSESGLMVYPE